METYYTIYKTTNKINGRIYIGCHKTTDLDDGYIGSGKILKRAIGKYGLEHFKKEILEVFDNPEDMFEMEATLVSDTFVKSKGTYNLKEGGYGGFDHLREKTPEHIHNMMHGLRDWHRTHEHPRKGNNLSEEYKLKISDGVRRTYDNGRIGSFTGKTHSTKTKDKMSTTKSGTGTGKDNSQHGTMWITNGKINKKLKRVDIIPDGWYAGRTMK